MFISHCAGVAADKIRASTWNALPKHMIFQGSHNMVDWTDIEERTTGHTAWGSNEQRVFWVGAPTGDTALGVPPELLAEVTSDPFQFEGPADISNICTIGAGAASRDPHEGCVECLSSGGH